MSDLTRVRTRRSLHAVAESVLAGPQHRTSGRIELRVSPGGFSTTGEPALAVVGTDVVGPGGTTVAIPGHSARELAAAFGLAGGAPIDVYAEGSGVNLDEPLQLDPAVTAELAESYARGDAALRRLAPDVVPVLWPEHFDVGIRIDQVNFGVSPGDDFVTVPYAYVGVDPVPADDPFWNAPFGVARAMSEFADADGVLTFFVDARDRHR